MLKIKQILIVVVCGFSAACWSPDDNRPTRNSGTPNPTNAATAAPISNAAKNSNNGANVNNKVSNNSINEPKKEGFEANLPSGFQMPTDSVGQRMLKEYGAMFVAKNVTPPNVVVFKNETEVSSFQAGVQKSTENIGGVTIELQTAAMNALKEAVAEAKSKNLSITPRNADSAKRSFQQTVDNWKSRVDPGLAFWLSKGKISQADVNRIKDLSPSEQVPEIFKLEDQGIFFAKGNEKSIIYSVAPPGISQHISMLALDVAEFESQPTREILAAHGWFQTVTSDLPHFTYLGLAENELTNRGLKKVTQNERTFWTPDL